jgi:hypothetical protein
MSDHASHVLDQLTVATMGSLWGLISKIPGGTDADRCGLATSVVAEIMARSLKAPDMAATVAGIINRRLAGHQLSWRLVPLSWAMHFILGLTIASVVLWVWFGGNPIVRIFMFLLIACVGALLCAGNVAAILAAAVAAWFIAGLPTYWYRYRQQPPPLRLAQSVSVPHFQENSLVSGPVRLSGPRVQPGTALPLPAAA